MKYVRLDVHKEYCDATMLDDFGQVVKTGKFKYSKEAFEEFFKCIDDAIVAIEDGYCWRPFINPVKSPC